MISEQKFICDFLDFKMESSPEPEIYRNYFMKYDSSKWKAGRGGGFFKYFDGNGMVYCLLVTDDSRYGIMLSYEKWDDRENRPIKTWYSVGDEKSLNEMVNNEDEFKIPLGIYVKPEKAWSAVEHFLTEPATMSKAIQWIESNDVPALKI